MDSKELDFAFPRNQVQEMKMAFMDGDVLQVAEKIKRSLIGLDGVPLNVAVTGESGSGKSTFINAIRGLGDEDEGSAMTGVVETTVVAKPYPHPRHRNVTYWDLPGIGTPSFRPIDYLESVRFNRFDLFFIVASGRFRACHVQLARAVEGAGKRFYFIRSKIDADLTASRRFRKSGYDEERIVGEIRSDCVKGLFDGGIALPRVFLLSCMELEKYDFHLMKKTVEDDLPGHQRHIFLISLPNIYSQVLKSKRNSFRNQIWKHALASAAQASLLVPGLSGDGDINLLVNAMKEYKEAFGLDEGSLNCLAKMFDRDVRDLMSAIRCRLALQEITSDMVVNLLHRRELTMAAVKVVEYAAKEVPLIRNMTAGGVAFGTAYWLLYSFLKDIADDAERVLERLVENTL